MNYGMIRFMIGRFLTAAGLMMIFPIFVSLYYREAPTTLISFVIPMVSMISLGLLMSTIRVKQTAYFAHEGLVIVGLAWVLVSLFGALPYVLLPSDFSFADAFFESCSSFSTTGATVFTDISGFPRSLLFWRSLSLFLGGLGILAVVILAIPTSGSSGVFIMRAELPGKKLSGRNRTSITIYYGIYLALTLSCFIALTISGVPPFDALLIALNIAGTGGFDTGHKGSAIYANPSSAVVMTIFMFIFGLNFGLFYLLLSRKFEKIFRDEEFRWYLGMIFVPVILISLTLRPYYQNFAQLLREVFFTVTSTISTTSYEITDPSKWTTLPQIILLILAFSGSMSGSTTGALKIYRVAVYVKTFFRELLLAVFPNRNIPIRFDGQIVPDKKLAAIHRYLISYALIFFGMILLVSFSAPNFSSAFSAVVATLNNTGHGLDIFGTAADYSVFSSFAKVVFAFGMLAGRLEIYPILILFSPATYKKG